MSVKSDLPDETPTIGKPEAMGHSIVYGDRYDLSGDFRGAVINIHSQVQSDKHWENNRPYMLQRIRNDWLEGVLEPAQVSHPLIGLGIDQNSRLVESPWDTSVQREMNTTPLQADSNQILRVFDSAKGNLLILGEPGGGKTITLLKLANELINRAEKNPEYPIPIVLNLASWGERRNPLENWLVEELRGKYFVAKQTAEAWIKENVLTLLLDGLDEIQEPQRSACIEAINIFRIDHGPVQIVVCCRRADYEGQPMRLNLDRAIILKPLEQEQIDEFLSVHRQGKDVAEILSQDATLRQLSRTPLMLNIMLAASQEVSAQDWSQLGSLDAHSRQLFDVYLNSVFRRRRPSNSEAEASTLRVLAWLAQNMIQQGQTVFLIEGLNPQWLKTKLQRFLSTLVTQFLIASMLAFAMGLVYVFALSERELVPRMALAIGSAALVTGLAGPRLNNFAILVLNMALTSITCGWALEDFSAGLIVGIIFGIPGGVTSIASGNAQMTDKLHWSWKRVFRISLFVILIEAAAGLWLSQIVDIKTLSMIAAALQFAALPIGVGITLAFGRRPNLRVAQTVKPNQGFWQSLSNSTGIMVFLLLVLLPLSLPSGLSRNFEENLSLWDWRGILSSFLFVFSTGLLLALPIGLLSGGVACLQHMIVRSMLVGFEKLPWNMVEVLNVATDRILLQRVGGGYIFQHRLLQDYFATSKFMPIEKETP